ncbi:unnamed protein product [Aphanomyces euteiches]|nr:hypothetical protein LEN26_020042 [Aphanomyces euteiches]KAH9116223.1 hypothetical protein AeMF1_009800 [Aphanomyces euteiches]KAH9132007.1 hypothetical protein AeRB84_021480 [Aphanomyces euteiches]KAH9194117.1 hypothetical protein AeNC1_003924 [Aphanomyces euteiches]
MVLISDITPGPSYFLMMHTPWSDYDPTSVERNLVLARRSTAPKRTARTKSPTKQTRSQSLQPTASVSSMEPEDEPKVHPLPAENAAMSADVKKKPHVLHRSMSEMPVSLCNKMAYEEPSLPQLIGGGPNDILSDPKVSKYLVPKLEACLPYRYRHKNWKLSYSLAQHGASLHTLYRRVRSHDASLVIIETDDGDIFGGFAMGTWTPSGLYHGNGESFVFTCVDKFEFFPWSRKNSLIMFADGETIAMGGGGGFAWALNHDMSQGTSSPTMTFDNRSLARRCNFGVINCEVWEFVFKFE